MTPRLQKLHDALTQAGFRPTERLNELTLEVPAADYLALAKRLRDEFAFEQLIDLCGVDYAAYGDRPREGLRFAAVLHLLSVSRNVRLRVRSFCPHDEFPAIASIVVGSKPRSRKRRFAASTMRRRVSSAFCSLVSDVYVRFLPLDTICDLAASPPRRPARRSLPASRRQCVQ